MSIYQAKHKARGRYGILMPSGEWFNNFLGDKQQAQSKAEELNQKEQLQQATMVVNANNAFNSNNSRKVHFTLTAKGWISTGE